MINPLIVSLYLPGLNWRLTRIDSESDYAQHYILASYLANSMGSISIEAIVNPDTGIPIFFGCINSDSSLLPSFKTRQTYELRHCLQVLRTQIFTQLN